MLNLEKVHKQYGPQVILDEAEMFIGPIDRVGLVGPNGAGKTTLLRMIMGREEADAGKIDLDSWATVGMLDQESQCRLGITVGEEMRSTFHEVGEAQQDIDVLSEELAYAEGFDQREKLRQLSQAQMMLEMQEAHTIDARIGKILHGLGFDDDAMERLTDEFSGGWQMRIAMAKLLLREPHLLMLDEPTNHLDAAALKWLQGYLEDYPGAVLMISHDSRFLDSVVTRIVELDEAKLHDYTGTFTHYQRVKEERREAQIAAYERQQRELARQQEFIDRFGAKATKATQVKSREKQLEKIELIEMPKEKRRAMVLQFPPAPRAAQEVMRLRGIGKSYNEQVVLKEIDIKLKRGDRIALLGPNGAGKSTLLRLIAGIEEPDTGEREVGRSVEIGYFAQHQAEALDPGRTVMQEALHGLENQAENAARGVLGRLLIRGDEVFKPVGVLSGGERARLALAKFLMRPANVLLLDEPTNHLDIASREVLKEAVAAFEGTVVVVSHDRAFVNAVATEAYTLEDGVLVEQRHSIAPPQKVKKK